MKVQNVNKIHWNILIGCQISSIFNQYKFRNGGNKVKKNTILKGADC